MNDYSENTLIQRCKAGDKDAFRILVEHYKKPAYSFAFSYVRCADDALAVSQDAFVRAWNAIGTFLEGRKFGPWLFSIVKNLSINHIEKKKSLREISLDNAMEESGFDLPSPGDDPHTELERKELSRLVWRAIMSLKDEHREILVLKHMQDMSYHEIGETLGIPEGTVMSRLYYARLELKQKLDPAMLRS